MGWFDNPGQSLSDIVSAPTNWATNAWNDSSKLVDDSSYDLANKRPSEVTGNLVSPFLGKWGGDQVRRGTHNLYKNSALMSVVKPVANAFSYGIGGTALGMGQAKENNMDAGRGGNDGGVAGSGAMSYVSSQAGGDSGGGASGTTYDSSFGEGGDYGGGDGTSWGGGEYSGPEYGGDYGGSDYQGDPGDYGFMANDTGGIDYAGDMYKGYESAGNAVYSADNIDQGLHDMSMDQGSMSQDASWGDSTDTPSWWDKFSNTGMNFGKKMAMQGARNSLNNSKTGRDVNKGIDMYDGYNSFANGDARTPGFNGNSEGGGGGGGFNWKSGLNTLGNLYANYQTEQNIDKQRGMMQGDMERSRAQYAAMPTLDSMYGANSPYAAQMRQELARKDAKAGRNSQYGPREAQFQAHMADRAAQYGAMQSRANAEYMTTNSAANKALGDLDSRRLGNQVAMAKNVWRGGNDSGLFSGLGSLFGGGGGGQSNDSTLEWT